MATRVGARVEIDADGRGARREFGRMERAARDLGREFRDVGREAIATGLGVAGLGTIEETLARAADFAREAMEAFTAANREAGAMAAGTASKFEDLKVAVGAAALGGENAERVFGALQAVTGNLQAAVAANESQFREFTVNALAVALDAVAMGIRFVGGLAQTFEVAKLAIKAAALGATELGIALSQGVIVVAREAMEMTAALTEQLASFTRGAAQAAGRVGMRGLAEQLNGIADGMDAGAAGVAEMAAETETMRLELIATRDALRTGFARDVEDTTARMDQLQQMIDGAAGSFSDVADQLRDGSTEWQVYTEAVGAAGDEIEETTGRISTMRHEARVAFNDLRDLANSIGAFASSGFDVANTAAEKANIAAERADERQQAGADKYKEALTARIEAAQNYASEAGNILAQVTSGQAKALDAIKAFIGQELIAKGQARLLEAAALFFVPGQQAAAVGMTAAAGAMIAAGAALSRTGGGSGGGGSVVGAGVAPAPVVAQTRQQTDVTVISNFGVVGDPREAARVVADSVRTATREGYL